MPKTNYSFILGGLEAFYFQVENLWKGGGPPKIFAPPARGILKFISPAGGHLVFQFFGRAGERGHPQVKIHAPRA